MTTVTAPALQERLRSFVDDGVTHVALETSSHALAQRRVEQVDYRVAVFTRITSEHLDFHGTWEEYLAAKTLLAHTVASRSDGVLVLDADDDLAYPRLSAIAVSNRLTYSASGSTAADLSAAEMRAHPGGVDFVARTPWGSVRVPLRLAGAFNVANALAALAAACSSGASAEQAAGGLSRLEHVTGRMERVDLGQPFSVVVDYAHTAEALATVLRELRAVTSGRLWAVFGSAGERDLGKRPEMGRVAAQLADVVVLTDEDPRHEDRLRILDDIAAGARAAGARDGEDLHLVPDRDRAIAMAVSQARGGDTVLCAGKGHESCILVGDERVPWDERAAAATAVRDWLQRNQDRSQALARAQTPR